MTSLPNRNALHARLAADIEKAPCSLLLLDLDGFKHVNDTLGHSLGDALLAAVAARLMTAVGDAGLVARLGGDEFVVLVDGATFGVAPELVAERLLDVMRQPFELDAAPMPLIINASIAAVEITCGAIQSFRQLCR